MYALGWHAGGFRQTKWIKSRFEGPVAVFMPSRNIPPSSSARADSGKRQNGSGEAQPTLKATQEEAEGSGWTRALRVRRICWLHGAETRHHDRIQHCHCRWRDRDQLCCAEYPTGRHEGYHKSYCFIVIITSPISFFLKTTRNGHVLLTEVPRDGSWHHSEKQAEQLKMHRSSDYIHLLLNNNAMLFVALYY